MSKKWTNKPVDNYDEIPVESWEDLNSEYLGCVQQKKNEIISNFQEEWGEDKEHRWEKDYEIVYIFWKPFVRAKGVVFWVENPDDIKKIEKIKDENDLEKFIRRLVKEREKYIRSKPIENWVEVEKGFMMWYHWNVVHIDLPAIWKFEWFKFSCFYPYPGTDLLALRNMPQANDNSYSIKELADLLKAINAFMAELHLENDKKVDYEKMNQSSKALECLIDIAQLEDCGHWYWLKDEIRDSKYDAGSRAVLRCDHAKCLQYANSFIVDYYARRRPRFLIKLSGPYETFCKMKK